MKWIAESYETKKRVLVHMCRYSRFLLRVTISSDLFCAQREPEIWAIYEHHVTLSAEGRASQAEKKVSLTKNHELPRRKREKRYKNVLILEMGGLVTLQLKVFRCW